MCAQAAGFAAGLYMIFLVNCLNLREIAHRRLIFLLLCSVNRQRHGF